MRKKDIFVSDLYDVFKYLSISGRRQEKKTIYVKKVNNKKFYVVVFIEENFKSDIHNKTSKIKTVKYGYSHKKDFLTESSTGYGLYKEMYDRTLYEVAGIYFDDHARQFSNGMRVYEGNKNKALGMLSVALNDVPQHYNTGKIYFNNETKYNPI